ncbi:MAG: hypothetical protein QE263_06570 [Vampirovibrionales bacterium]|nr:hypothetical protein [Vampirovibrionales bacterium]
MHVSSPQFSAIVVKAQDPKWVNFLKKHPERFELFSVDKASAQKALTEYQKDTTHYGKAPSMDQLLSNDYQLAHYISGAFYSEENIPQQTQYMEQGIFVKFAFPTAVYVPDSV